MSVFLFLFLNRLGLAYGAINTFIFAQGQEASEFDQPQGKILFRALKIIAMTLTLFQFAPTLPIAVLLISVYGAHAFYLTKFDASVNRADYNQYLQLFWRGFALLTIASLGVQLVVAGTPFAMGLLAAAFFPFLVKELKTIVSPMSRVGHILHTFDDNFAKWAPLASLLVLPTTFMGRLLNYFVVAINVYQPIVDNISYIFNRLLSLNVMRAASAFFRFHYMPNIVKNSYNASFGRLHDEFEAFFDYYHRPELTTVEMKQIIDSGDVAGLRPAVENLYKGRPRKAFIPSTDIIGAAQKARELFQQALQRTVDDPDCFNELLAQMAEKSSCFEEIAREVESQVQKNALLLVIKDYISGTPDYAVRLAEESESVKEAARVIVDNIKMVFNIISNPRVQLGADQVKGTSDKIPAGLAALFEKFLNGMNEIHGITESPEYESRSEEMLSRNYLLMASIFDTALRCQNALQGLIAEETQGDFVYEPLIASWGEYVNQQIAGAQTRLVTAFTREVAYDPNGAPDEDIQREFGMHVNSRYVAIIKAFFSFDPRNVDHQRIVASRFLPQQTEDETFRAFASVIIQRHLDWYEFASAYIGTSLFQHLLYPTLLSSYTVEELIARTQQVYADTMMSREPGAQLPAWTIRWHGHWQSYLNNAYQSARIEEMPERRDSEALFNAYIAHQDNDQRALRLYDASVTAEERAAIHDQQSIGLVGAAKMEALVASITAGDSENLPEDFADWSEFKKRYYLHMDKAIVRGCDLYSGIVDQAVEGDLDAELKGQLPIVSREFALVVLFSEGLVTPEHSLHQKLGELGAIARFMNPEEKLKRLGYTN